MSKRTTGGSTTSTKTGKTRKSSKKSNVTPTGRFVQKEKSTYPKNDWVVFVTNGGRRNGTIVYPGKFTRDNVRNAYAREFGVSIQSTRSRRVSNF